MSRWLQYCIDKAKELPYQRREARVYAVILDKRGRLVSESSNSYSKTHTKQAEFAEKVGLPDKIFGHAELIASIKDKNKRGVKVVVARVDSLGNPCNSAPCKICSRAIKEHGGIKSVEFSI